MQGKACVDVENSVLLHSTMCLAPLPDRLTSFVCTRLVKLLAETQAACEAAQSPEAEVACLVICPGSEITAMTLHLPVEAFGIALHVAAEPVDAVSNVLVLVKVRHTSIHSTNYSCSYNDLAPRMGQAKVVIVVRSARHSSNWSSGGKGAACCY